MSNADMPAMPTRYDYEKDIFMCEGGLTKREHFAAMAMQGLLSNPETGDSTLWDNAPEWATQMTSSAVEFADALLAEMEQKKVKP